MAELKYVDGDATQPQGPGLKYIIHCCNDVGAWGAGFVLAISKRWPGPEKAYREWAESDSPTLPIAHLQQAVDHLDEADVVLGPCEDGGYYLIGLKHPQPE